MTTEGDKRFPTKHTQVRYGGQVEGGRGMRVTVCHVVFVRQNPNKTPKSPMYIVLQSQVQSGFFTFLGVTGTITSLQKEAK
jgi:hypothetical protein